MCKSGVGGLLVRAVEYFEVRRWMRHANLDGSYLLNLPGLRSLISLLIHTSSIEMPGFLLFSGGSLRVVGGPHLNYNHL